MAAKKAIPDSDHVCRFVPHNKQIRDPDTDEFKGISSAAFALRAEDKGGLSLTWIEYFGTLSLATKVAAACAYRASLDSKRIGTKAAFATATVSALKTAAAAEPFAKRVRVVHAPVAGNLGHVEARRFTDEDLQLLDLMAVDVFTEVDIVGEMNLPPVATA